MQVSNYDPTVLNQMIIQTAQSLVQLNNQGWKWIIILMFNFSAQVMTFEVAQVLSKLNFYPRETSRLTFKIENYHKQFKHVCNELHS